jgi:ketosteroid isomerase-like protein
MPDEKLDLIRSGFAAHERGDLDAMVAPFSDDVVFYRADPEGAYFHGKDGFLQAFREWTEGFEDFSAAPDEFFGAGEWVVARVTQTARWAGGGAPVESEFWFVFQVTGGRIVRFEIYADRDAAFAAAGMAG